MNVSVASVLCKTILPMLCTNKVTKNETNEEKPR
jgi:hypothetical protein